MVVVQNLRICKDVPYVGFFLFVFLVQPCPHTTPPPPPPYFHFHTRQHTLLHSASSAQVVVSTASAADAQLIMGCDRLADFISEQSPARDGN